MFSKKCFGRNLAKDFFFGERFGSAKVYKVFVRMLVNDAKTCKKCCGMLANGAKACIISW